MSFLAYPFSFPNHQPCIEKFFFFNLNSYWFLPCVSVHWYCQQPILQFLHHHHYYYLSLIHILGLAIEFQFSLKMGCFPLLAFFFLFATLETWTHALPLKHTCLKQLSYSLGCVYGNFLSIQVYITLPILCLTISRCFGSRSRWGRSEPSSLNYCQYQIVQLLK